MDEDQELVRKSMIMSKRLRRKNNTAGTLRGEV
jgi:hypothetical protein